MDKETAMKIKESLLRILTTYPLLLEDNSTFISAVSYFKDYHQDLYTQIMQTIAIKKLRTFILHSKS